MAAFAIDITGPAWLSLVRWVSFALVMKYIALFLASFVLFRLIDTLFVRPKRRVRVLLAQYPDAEQISVFPPSLPASFWQIWGKQREIFAKIDEMKAQGWTFLRTIRSPGGGATLHFIRTKDFTMRDGV